MQTSTNVARRRVVKASVAATTGLTLGFHFPAKAQGSKVAAMNGAYVTGNPALNGSTRPINTQEVNAWVVVNPDDSVVIRIARSEMGQGTLTGLAQLVAEELECDWNKVSTTYPTPGQNVARQRVWGNFSTGGSRGIRESAQNVLKGGAAARMLLVQAAANQWQVPASECIAANSVITHKASNRSISFGKVATAAGQLATSDAIKNDPAFKDPKLKDPKSWRLVGKSVARLDTVDKTNGKQVYGMDLQLPGMLNAAVRACPVMGGKIKSFNANAINKRPGVKHVLSVSDNAVVVIADTYWRAKSALDALPIEWDEGPNSQFSSEEFAKVLRTALDAPEAAVGVEIGKAKEQLTKAGKTFEAVYSYPHQNHACMETMNATVRWTPEKCEVWAPTQNGEASLAAASEAAGLPQAQCDVYKIHLGGGFGRRGQQDFVSQAVRIARQVPGVPIKVVWSREEDMIHGRFHPTTQCKLTASVDSTGAIDSLHMRIAGQSILAAVAPQAVRNGVDPVMFQGLLATGAEGSIGYTIPNLLVDHAMRNPPVPVGFWRGVNLNQNAIYLECFIDEVAHATKQDPLELRRKMMANHPKHLAVLNTVAQKAGWGTPAAPGVHRGIAQIMGFGSYVAACAEISIKKDGQLKIHRIVAATDCGFAVNPQQIEAQVEGSFVYGLSAALYQECTAKNGRMQEHNFHQYKMMKLEDMPKVETTIMNTGGFWGGVGEPTIAVAAPAVLNAIFAATGKRIRRLPIGEQDLTKA